MNPHVKILILNWNGIHLLQPCLNSVNAINYPNYSIMVIDNGSTDGSLDMVKKNYPNVECMDLDKNYGFSGGYNRCFSQLGKESSAFIMLLNNDTEVDTEILNSFNDAREKFGDNYIYGGKIYYMDNPETIWYAGGKVNLNLGWISHKGIRNLDSEDYSITMETDYVTGCCIFTSMQVINQLDGFDERFNMYGEDVDLCLRAKKVGIQCYYWPKAKLWHKVSSSIGGQYSIRKWVHKQSSKFKLLIINISSLAKLADLINSVIIIIKYHIGFNVKTQDERADPHNPEWKNHQWSVVFNKRTEYAKKYVADKFVLDLCCGTGWMTYEISKIAKRVIGVDYSEDAIKTAMNNYSYDNITYEKMNALDLTFVSNHFETIVSMEAIEHFTKEDGKIFISEAYRVLKKGGVFVGSTPETEYRNPIKLLALKKIDPFHLFLYSKNILEDVLSEIFSEVSVIPQKEGWLFFIAKK